MRLQRLTARGFRNLADLDCAVPPRGVALLGPNAQGKNDCKLSDYDFSGSTATYKMVCTKPQPMTMTGEMKYTGTDAYVGTVKMDMSGQKVTMAVDAKRLGDCTK